MNQTPSPKRRLLGNWKMCKTPAQSRLLASALMHYFTPNSFGSQLLVDEVLVFPSFVSLQAVHEVLSDGPIKLGAQDLFWEETGAYTGEVDATSLKEIGCQM